MNKLKNKVVKEVLDPKMEDFTNKLYDIKNALENTEGIPNNVSVVLRNKVDNLISENCSLKGWVSILLEDK